MLGDMNLQQIDCRRTRCRCVGASCENTSMANLSTSKQLLDLLSGWRADWKPIGWSTGYGFNHHKHWLLKFYLFINAAYVGVISPTSARFKVFVYICCIQASATGALALAFLCVAAASSLLTHLWLTYAMTWAHAVSFQWFGWLEIRSIDNWESRGKPNGGMHLLFYRENFWGNMDGWKMSQAWGKPI